MLQADVNLSKLLTQTIDNIDETIIRRSCSNSYYSNNTNFDVAVRRRRRPLSNSHYSNNTNLDVAVRCRPWSNTRYSNNSNFDVAVHSIILATRIKHYSCHSIPLKQLTTLTQYVTVHFSVTKR